MLHVVCQPPVRVLAFTGMLCRQILSMSSTRASLEVRTSLIFQKSLSTSTQEVCGQTIKLLNLELRKTNWKGHL